MKIEGNLSKLSSEFANPIQYSMKLGDDLVLLNDYIGQKIKFSYSGRINCSVCGKLTKKSFSQGFCYNCFQSAPQADESVFRPELSKAQFGKARDLEWAEEHDLIDHYVYLSVTSGLKVGVTRHHQVPTRWIDQGATEAIIVAKTPNRHIAGVIENYLKKFYADKTDWRAMLKTDKLEGFDLIDEKSKLLEKLPDELLKYTFTENEVMKLAYPVNEYASKISSVGLDKTPEIEGNMLGIKGQYLIFENGKVFNVRKHTGYYVTVFFNE